MRRSGAWGIRLVTEIRNHLSVKLFLQLFCILSITCIAIVATIQYYLPIRYNEKILDDLKVETNELVNTLENTPESNMEDYIMAFCLKNGTEAQLYDDNYNEIYNVDFSKSILTKDATIGHSISWDFVNSDKLYCLDISISHMGGVDIVNTIISSYPLICGVIFVFSMVISLIYTKFIAKPIVDISKIAQRMTTLDMTWQCNIMRTDEIGLLADSLNKMSLQLSSTLENLKSSNIMLQDKMDEEREQILQRSNLFMAISHELKTPLTILKGETEGMLMNLKPFDNRDKYLLHSLQVIETMDKLVQDILTTAQLQTHEKLLHLSDYDIRSLVLDAIEKEQDIVELKKIELLHELLPELYVTLDRELFSKIVHNLINNGIVHSKINSSVLIRMSHSGNDCILTIENTNAHIPENEIHHIFQPFYQIDKSHSSIGNGIGLYIVKTFLDELGFEYDIINQENSVLFTIIMPLTEGSPPP